ncbi:MAG: heavy metal translocating P-type ATPase [Spirochaetaceae bacterium]|jgi:Cd2+/Zn2+-exporting ATPase|nr:heavy metal translocating P-type ATPase [Spirochaetaceae bacterium]
MVQEKTGFPGSVEGTPGSAPVYRAKAHDDDCCPACAAARSKAPGPNAATANAAGPNAADKTSGGTGHGRAAGEGPSLRFGSYALPRRRVLVFGAALSLWVLGLILIQLCPQWAARWAAAGNPVPGELLRYLPLFPLLSAYALAGLPVLRNAFRNLRRGRALDENFLMSIATIGAFAIGEWEEAVGVMIFYMIGELIQEAAVVRSRSSIDALLALKPDTARVKTGDTWTETAAGGVLPGSLVLVRPGERIPLDGIITEGAGMVDASMLSGESRPVERKQGDEVRSGTVSLDGVLVIQTTKTADDSSAARIIALVESARELKAKPERFITAFAKWYTPLVVGGALILAILPPILIPGARFTDWLYRALILLVISCPCALVVSIPLGYFAGIGGMSRRGIMVKGAVHLDSLNKTKYVAFDKTGTLTEGKFSVAALEPAPGIDKRRLLETAVLAESGSNHPIAQAICRAGQAAVPGDGPIRAPEAGPGCLYREIAGQGLELSFGAAEGGQSILAGNRKLLESRGIPISGGRGTEENPAGSAPETEHTAVYLARDGRYYGRILVGDTIKEGAGEAVARLGSLGITETVIFTGDARAPAQLVGDELGVAAVKAELLPEDKLVEMEKLTRRGTAVFVGDGINDAPVLARSDVGIAMGSGADAAVEAADVIIMTDDPRRVPEAIVRARKTRRIVLGNVIFALGAKGIFISLAVLGLANMWIALLADVGVALLAILNSTRALR